MSSILARLPGDDALRLVMAASGIGMALADMDGVMQEVNPAFCRMLGYDSSELIGRRYLDIVHPDEVEACVEFVQELMRHPDNMLDQRRRYICSDGSVLHAHLNVAVLRDREGQPLCLLAQIHDIADEVAREASLRASVEHRGAELEVSHRQLQLFADAVTHDLRAPLRAIEGFSERLARNLEGQLDDVSSDHLERIRSAAARMSGLLAALGRLSQATRAEMRLGPVDLSLLADWTWAEHQDTDPARVVQVRIQPGLEVEGDERLLKAMLDELIDNAWKFTRDRPDALVQISGEAEGGMLKVEIRDNGSGFDMRYAHKLYEPFQRLHGPEQGGGHGLGLAIARRVAERHGGLLQADSTPGVGSCFVVRLPREQASAVTARRATGAPRVAADTATKAIHGDVD
ncbi:sensor histidine kinase [Marilutibacter alkalisoli]|nr:HAMP domain-containing sensor histidine kinase [Lysobacter alkalisoli]